MTRTYLFKLIACDLAAAGATFWPPLESSAAATGTIWLLSLTSGLATLAWVTVRGITHAYPETFTA